GRHGDGIITTRCPAKHLDHAIGDDLAADEELPLEVNLVVNGRNCGDEHLAMPGLGFLDGHAQHAIVDGNVAPPDDAQTFLDRRLAPDALDLLTKNGFARHEQVADAILPRGREAEFETLSFVEEKFVRQLRHDAGAVARLGIGADRAAVLEILQYGQAGLDDGVAGEVVDIGVKTDAAGVMIARGVIEAVRCRYALRAEVQTIDVIYACHQPFLAQYLNPQGAQRLRIYRPGVKRSLRGEMAAGLFDPHRHSRRSPPERGEPLIAFGGGWLLANRAEPACNQTSISVCAKDHICPKRTATLSYRPIFARMQFRSQVFCVMSTGLEILFQTLERGYDRIRQRQYCRRA